MGTIVSANARGAAGGAAAYLALFVLAAVGLALLDDGASDDPVLAGIRLVVVYAALALALARSLARSAWARFVDAVRGRPDGRP